MNRIPLWSAALGCLLYALASLGQHEFTQTDIDRGGQLYGGTCIGCHGPDGDLAEGVSIADPAFLQSRSDEQLFAVIRGGVPDTAMLANPNYSDLQINQIVAYLRDLSARGRVSVDGDAARGRELFESNDCLSCHRVRLQGSPLGPDLSRIGLLRRTDELEEALLDPDATILPENRYVALTTAAGEDVTGRLLNHDRFTVQLLDEDENLRLFDKAGLRRFEFLEGGLMPSYGELERRDIIDLLSYLTSLRGDLP